MTILQGNKRFVESQFKLESDFEELVRSQSKVLFGKDAIFIYTKRKLKGLVLGNTIPDGFLFDLTDSENPVFFLVEIELQKHDFKKHILPQITNFFEFFRSSASQYDLVKDLFSIINADATLKREFKKYLGNKEIFKFLKDICEDSQNILLVIDGEKKEFASISSGHKDTWGKFVRTLVVKKFNNENKILISVEPDFMDILNSTDDEDEEVLKKEHKDTSQRAMIAAEISTRRNASRLVSKAAKSLNVSRDYVHKAMRVKKASPSLAKLVMSGKLSLHAAEMRIATSAK